MEAGVQARLNDKASSRELLKIGGTYYYFLAEPFKRRLAKAGYERVQVVEASDK